MKENPPFILAFSCVSRDDLLGAWRLNRVASTHETAPKNGSKSFFAVMDRRSSTRMVFQRQGSPTAVQFLLTIDYADPAPLLTPGLLAANGHRLCPSTYDKTIAEAPR